MTPNDIADKLRDAFRTGEAEPVTLPPRADGKPRRVYNIPSGIGITFNTPGSGAKAEQYNIPEKASALDSTYWCIVSGNTARTVVNTAFAQTLPEGVLKIYDVKLATGEASRDQIFAIDAAYLESHHHIIEQVKGVSTFLQSDGPATDAGRTDDSYVAPGVIEASVSRRGIADLQKRSLAYREEGDEGNHSSRIGPSVLRGLAGGNEQTDPQGAGSSRGAGRR